MRNNYQVMIIDPPWENYKSARKSRPQQSTGFDYPVMPAKEIFMLLDTEILILATITHCLFMWTIERALLECEVNMEQRGYKRHCRFIWNKGNGIAPAFTVRYAHEYLIWYYKPTLLPVSNNVRGKYLTVINAKPRQHSRKPDEAYAMIEELYPDSIKLDVFSREKREQWDQYGNQLDFFNLK